MPSIQSLVNQLERAAENLEREQRVKSGVQQAHADYPAFRQFSQRYWSDPVGFATDILDMELTEYQAEALEELVQYRRLAIRSGHGAGKTRLIAVAAVWFMLTREGAGIDWKVPITASVERQLTHVAYPEIERIVETVNWDLVGRSPLNQDQHEVYVSYIDLRYGRLFTIATDTPAKLEGVHATQVFFILDEAKAIEVPYWESVEGALSTDGAGDQEAYVLVTSTPGPSAGKFYEIHQQLPAYAHWRTMHWTLERAIAANRMSRTWVEQCRNEWGENSPMFQRRVLGEFYDDMGESIIPLSAVEASQAKWVQLNANLSLRDEPYTCIGVDVAAGGGDKSVVAIRYGHTIAELRYYDTDTMVLTGVVSGLLTQYGGYAVIDMAGVGIGVIDRLRELGYGDDLIPFHAQHRTEKRDKTGELGFSDARSAAWWFVREGLLNGSLIVPPNDPSMPKQSLAGDLVCGRWEIRSDGKVSVESKKSIKRRLGRSPDAGDAVVMAFWEKETYSGTFMLAPIDIDQRPTHKAEAANRAEEYRREWGDQWRNGNI
jgi:hypothetical protein